MNISNKTMKIWHVDTLKVSDYVYQRSDFIFLLHPLYKVIDEYWPCVRLTVIFLDVLHNCCKFVEHIPEIFMAFCGLFST